MVPEPLAPLPPVVAKLSPEAAFHITVSVAEAGRGSVQDKTVHWPNGLQKDPRPVSWGRGGGMGPATHCYVVCRRPTGRTLRGLSQIIWVTGFLLLIHPI